jgi:hypothetical protein
MAIIHSRDRTLLLLHPSHLPEDPIDIHSLSIPALLSGHIGLGLNYLMATHITQYEY